MKKVLLRDLYTGNVVQEFKCSGIAESIVPSHISIITKDKEILVPVEGYVVEIYNVEEEVV